MNPETSRRRRSNPDGPPRAVPLAVRLRLMVGGPIAQVGWAVFGFGMIFVWVFTANSDLTSGYYFRGTLVTVPSLATDCQKTNFSEGGGEDSTDTPVFALSYRFIHDDREYAGTSYVTGQEMKPDQDIMVEFPQGRPDISRVRGMRRAPFGAETLFVLIFPLVGLCCFLPGLIIGRRTAWFIANGVQTGAKWVGKETTNTRINDRTVYRVTLEYQDFAGLPRRLTMRTTEPDKFETAELIPVLFDPRRPARATALADRPGRPFIDPQTGEVRQKEPGKNFLVLILPLASILGNAAWIVFKLL